MALLEQKYVRLEDITDLFPVPVARILRRHYCQLPVCRNLLHCHCSAPYSLQCKCCALTVQTACEASLPVARIVKSYSTCCSRFDMSQCGSTIYVESSRRSVRDICFVLEECGILYSVFKSSFGACIMFKNVCKPSLVITLLIRMVNLSPSDRFGYHFGDPGERGGELGNGRVCFLRFIDANGLVQERLVKSLHFEDERAEEPSYPPPKLENGRWRCFYWPEACECEDSCSCNTFQSVALTPAGVRDYLLSNVTKPLALWRYVQVHF